MLGWLVDVGWMLVGWVDTLPETYSWLVAPENRCLEVEDDEVSFWGAWQKAYFQGGELLVSGRVRFV